MAITKFETGITHEVALKFKTGKEVTGRWGAQVQFVSTAGDVFFVPVAVGKEIDSLNLAPQESFLITKRSANDWSIERKPVAAGPQLVTNGAAKAEVLPVNGKGESALRIALRTVIDEAAEAEKYAAERGLNIRFDNCDLRAFVNTMMIGLQHAGGR